MEICYIAPVKNDIALRLEKFIKKENRNYVFDFSDEELKLLKVATSFAICLAMNNYCVLATEAVPVLAEASGLMPLFLKLLKYTRLVAYIVFVYKSLETVIKGAIEENIEACWKKVIGYVIGFLAVKFIPQLFDAINNM